MRHKQDQPVVTAIGAILFHSFLVRSSTTDNIDSNWAKIFLARCSNAFYWTLVQYARQRAFRCQVSVSEKDLI